MAFIAPTIPAVGDQITAAQGLVIATDLIALAEDTLNLPKAMASGSASVLCATPNVAESVAVVFPVGVFTAPPIVVVSLATGVTDPITAFMWPGAVTAAGFNAFLLRSSTTATAVNWIAIQA